MKLHQVRDVLAVADAGSLRAASRQLGVAQSAITRSIRQLEKELGAPLFERRKRGTVLTPMGTLFLRRARSASNELRRAREEIHQHQGGVTGSVVACLSTTPHMAMLPQAFGPFRKRYPLVKFHLLEAIEYQAIEPGLKDGTVDFYLGVAPKAAPSPGMLVDKLFDNPRIVVARRGHPMAKASTLAELTHMEWITTSPDSAHETNVVTQFRLHRLAPPERITLVNNALSVMILLTSSDALAFVPRQWAEFAPIRSVLQEVRIRERLQPASIALVRRADMPLTPAAEYLSSLLLRRIQP
jgi:DNA-binding transcriptional LysR family regulator